MFDGHLQKKGTDMKAIIDKETCLKCTMCERICPEAFAFADDGYPAGGEVPAGAEGDAQQAEIECPAGAITLE